MEQGIRVSLEQVLQARDARVKRQGDLLKKGGVVISFCMNIAGPVKDTPLVRRGFEEGCSRLEGALVRAGAELLHRERHTAPTGCEACYRLEADPLSIKQITVELENNHPLGRLFDLDVLRPDGSHVYRAEVGAPLRGCLICGAPGAACASRRLHSVEQLQTKTGELLRDFFLQNDLDHIAETAVRALLYEVCATPKPGLVDCENNGSHRDMDLYLFLDSVAALAPFFRTCAQIGQQTGGQPPGEAFARLRAAGKDAEHRMFRATKGINTHKGAIFSVGALCGAMGRLWREEGPCRLPDQILAAAADLVQQAVEQDFSAIRQGEAPFTAGGEQYIRHGIIGARGQVAQGFPAVRKIGLPVLRRALAAGKSLGEAGAIALLHLIAGVTDTNLIKRSSYGTQREVARRMQSLLAEEPLPGIEVIRRLDAQFIRENLSPGGCADLLAVTYLLFLWSEEATECEWID